MPRKYTRNHDALKAQALADPTLRWQFKSAQKNHWQTIPAGKHPAWHPFMSYRAQPADFAAPKGTAKSKGKGKGKPANPAQPQPGIYHFEDHALFDDAQRKLLKIIDIILSKD